MEWPDPLLSLTRTRTFTILTPTPTSFGVRKNRVGKENYFFSFYVYIYETMIVGGRFYQAFFDSKDYPTN